MTLPAEEMPWAEVADDLQKAGKALDAACDALNRAIGCAIVRDLDSSGLVVFARDAKNLNDRLTDWELQR